MKVILFYEFGTQKIKEERAVPEPTEGLDSEKSRLHCYLKFAQILP